MPPERFDTFLAACLRAFEDGRPADLDVLINQAASLAYDPATGRVTIEGDDTGVRYDLHGYKWLRPVPWEDD